jgi:hypothetical protein
MEERTEVVGARFTPRERKVLAAEAKRQGMTESGYLRAAGMFMLCMDGNVEALKMTAEMVKSELLDRFAKMRSNVFKEPVSA